MARMRRLPGNLFGHNLGEVTDEMRDRALAKTLEIVGKLDTIRKRLELPADQIELVSDTYGLVLSSLITVEFNAKLVDDAFAVPMSGAIDGDQLGALMGRYNGGDHGPYGRPFASRDVDGPGGAKRTPMPILSCDRMMKPCKIKSGEPFEVIVRPQSCAYRVEGLEIEGDATRWIVDDIKVGNRSQFVRSGSVPGRHFAKGGMLANIRLDTLQTAMDFVMVIRYVGPEKDGEEFVATAVGSEVG